MKKNLPFWSDKMNLKVCHKGAIKEQLAIHFGKYHFVEKKCFSWHLGHFFRFFKWKYCAVSENVFSLPGIYLHFSHCKFSLFFCEFNDLGSKLGLKTAQFRVWPTELHCTAHALAHAQHNNPQHTCNDIMKGNRQYAAMIQSTCMTNNVRCVESSYVCT